MINSLSPKGTSYPQYASSNVKILNELDILFRINIQQEKDFLKEFGHIAFPTYHPTYVRIAQNRCVLIKIDHYIKGLAPWYELDSLLKKDPSYYDNYMTEGATISALAYRAFTVSWDHHRQHYTSLSLSHSHQQWLNYGWWGCLSTNKQYDWNGPEIGPFKEPLNNIK